ncbi:MAG: hypothetical protein ABII74_05740 [Elusimicrobiota bacterium]
MAEKMEKLKRSGNARRVEPRRVSDFAASVAYLDDFSKEETRGYAKVVNVGKTGVSLVTEQMIRPETVVELAMDVSPAYPQVLARGKVVWNRWVKEKNENCYGVILMKFKEEERVVFEKFFKEFSSMAIVVDRRLGDGVR